MLKSLHILTNAIQNHIQLNFRLKILNNMVLYYYNCYSNIVKIILYCSDENPNKDILKYSQKYIKNEFFVALH